MVVEPGLMAAGHSGLGAHLETTNPSNIPFYRSIGFEVSGHHKLGPDRPGGVGAVERCRRHPDARAVGVPIGDRPLLPTQDERGSNEPVQCMMRPRMDSSPA